MRMNLNDLNKEQRLAAQTLEGPVLVLAGAGSGKTRALTYRVANLISRGVPPWSIMAITFTNKAAGEMKERLEKSLDTVSQMWISTIHSMCVRILRQEAEYIGYNRNFSIYSETEKESVFAILHPSVFKAFAASSTVALDTGNSKILSSIL